jgi:hypothetical protein
MAAGTESATDYAGERKYPLNCSVPAVSSLIES